GSIMNPKNSPRFSKANLWPVKNFTVLTLPIKNVYTSFSALMHASINILDYFLNKKHHMNFYNAQYLKMQVSTTKIIEK
ncbi:hypothetical protein, partial [Enterobacter cloacae]